MNAIKPKSDDDATKSSMPRVAAARLSSAGAESYDKALNDNKARALETARAAAMGEGVSVVLCCARRDPWLSSFVNWLKISVRRR